MSTYINPAERRIVAAAFAAGDLDGLIKAALLVLDPARAVAANEALPKDQRLSVLPFPHPDALQRDDLHVGMFVRLTGWHHEEIGLITDLGPDRFTLRLSLVGRPYRAWQDDGSGTYTDERHYTDSGAAPYTHGWNQANRLVPA